MAAPCFAFGPYDCHFFRVPTSDDVDASSDAFGNVPEEVVGLFNGPDKAKTIYHAAWGEDDSYYIGYQGADGNRRVAHRNLPQLLTTWLFSETSGFPRRDIEETRITLGPDGSFFAIDGGLFIWQNLNEELNEMLASLRLPSNQSGPKPKAVALGKDKETYILITSDGKMKWRISKSYEALSDWMESEQQENGTTRLNAVQHAAFNIHYQEDFLIVFKEGGFVGEMTEEQRMNCTTLCGEFQEYLKKKEEEDKRAKQKARPRTGLRETVLKPQSSKNRPSSFSSTEAVATNSTSKSPATSTSRAVEKATAVSSNKLATAGSSSSRPPAKSTVVPPATTNFASVSKGKETNFDYENPNRDLSEFIPKAPSSNTSTRPSITQTSTTRSFATSLYGLGTGYGSNPFGLGSDFGLGSSFGTYGTGFNATNPYSSYTRPNYASYFQPGSLAYAAASGASTQELNQKIFQSQMESMRASREMRHNMLMSHLNHQRALTQAQLAWAQSLYQPYGSFNPAQQQYFHYLASLYGPGGSANQQQQRWANEMIKQYTNNAGGGGANLAQNISLMTSGMDPNQVMGMTGMDPSTLMNLAGGLGAMGGGCSIM